MKQYEKETQKLLRQLGANGSYTGFCYTVYGVTQNIKNPDLVVYICKGLYVDIAEFFHVKIHNVERNIRTVVSIIWEYGDRELLNEVFGRKLITRPKNADFIDALTQYIISNYVEN